MKRIGENPQETIRRRPPLIHPDLVRLDQAALFLGEGNDTEPLYNLTKEQLMVYANCAAFHHLLIDGGIEGGIQPLMDFFDIYINLSPSIDGVGRLQGMNVLGSVPRYEQAPLSPEQRLELEQKRHPWWKFWQRK